MSNTYKYCGSKQELNQDGGLSIHYSHTLYYKSLEMICIYTIYYDILETIYNIIYIYYDTDHIYHIISRNLHIFIEIILIYAYFYINNSPENRVFLVDWKL